MVEYISVQDRPREFMVWLKRLELAGFSYEIVVEDYLIKRIIVREPDNGFWKDVCYGRILGSEMISYKQKIYIPRMVDGNFVYNYNGNNK